MIYVSSHKGWAKGNPYIQLKNGSRCAHEELTPKEARDLAERLLVCADEADQLEKEPNND